MRFLNEPLVLVRVAEFLIARSPAARVQPEIVRLPAVPEPETASLPSVTMRVLLTARVLAETSLAVTLSAARAPFAETVPAVMPALPVMSPLALRVRVLELSSVML